MSYLSLLLRRYFVASSCVTSYSLIHPTQGLREKFCSEELPKFMAFYEQFIGAGAGNEQFICGPGDSSLLSLFSHYLSIYPLALS